MDRHSEESDQKETGAAIKPPPIFDQTLFTMTQKYRRPAGLEGDVELPPGVFKANVQKLCDG